MTDRIFPPIQPVTQVPRVTPLERKPVQRTEKSGDFQKILTEKLGADLKISAHAQKRMAERGITLSPRDMTGISEAVHKAQTKGCKESLVVLDQVALVVSVENQTVITAVDARNLKENVFTNIDSAVFVQNN
ncbi:MAG TPA: flagellar protein [Firmicutes bacterium]|jgi:flagellar operon protein|nr:flagellar protein [Bacillota bacterium]